MAINPNTMERPIPIAVVVGRIFLFVFDAILSKNAAKNLTLGRERFSDFSEVDADVGQIHVRKD